MYKIIYNNTTFVIVNRKKKSKYCPHSETVIDSNTYNSFSAIFFVNKIEAKSNKIFILTDNIRNFFKKIKTELYFIKAAGGMVLNDKGHVLMIYRNNMWDLPKGKAEKNESIKKTALREVEEECGIGKLTILKKISPTYHIYKEKGRFILKKSFWYLMHSTDKKTPQPQTGENISEAVWMDKKQLQAVIDSAYLNIKLLLEKHYL